MGIWPNATLTWLTDASTVYYNSFSTSAFELATDFKSESELYILAHWRDALLVLLFYVLLGLATYLVSGRGSCFESSSRVLIVTAHPDDESMFFGPTVIALSEAKKEVFLLCLSYGDYYGRGEERKKELYNACDVLGLRQGNVTLMKCTDLPDDPYATWNESLVVDLVSRYVHILRIDTVLSFDKDGVSYHENHAALGSSLSLLVAPDVAVYSLETVNLLRKYSGPLDSLLSRLLSRHFALVSVSQHSRVVSAMSAHASQYLWYRRLFVTLSRYAYINTYRRLR